MEGPRGEGKNVHGTCKRENDSTDRVIRGEEKLYGNGTVQGERTEWRGLMQGEGDGGGEEKSRIEQRGKKHHLNICAPAE